METVSKLAEIYRDYEGGSPGFVREVQKNMGAALGCSDTEIERLGRACKSAREFKNDWAGAAYWTDEVAASRGQECAP